MKKILVVLLILLVVGCSSNKEIKKEQKDVIEESPKEEKILTEEDYKSNNVDELGEVPIMMYHGIHNKRNSETKYIGGNVDKDGYQRTSEAFANDLEFYYN